MANEKAQGPRPRGRPGGYRGPQRGPQHRPGRPPLRKSPARPPASPKLAAEAKKLVAEHDIPFRAAYQIASGDLTLTEYLKRAFRKAEIRKLTEQQQLLGGLAAMVVDQRLALERAQFLNRWVDYRRDNHSRSFFDYAASGARPFRLLMFDRRETDGQVLKNDKYEFVLKSGEDSPRLPKLDVKCAFDLEHGPAVGKLLKIDQAQRDRNEKPAVKVLERFRVRDQLLFELLENRTVLFLTLMEGELLRGIIEWFSDYEIGLLLKGGVPVVVLRHALVSVKTKDGRELGGFRKRPAGSQETATA